MYTVKSKADRQKILNALLQAPVSLPGQDKNVQAFENLNLIIRKINRLDHFQLQQLSTQVMPNFNLIKNVKGPKIQDTVEKARKEFTQLCLPLLRQKRPLANILDLDAYRIRGRETDSGKNTSLQ